ncbi:MAG: hypothetical protein A2Y33_02240 [Spirochaetes bacterium GWF1_51_8]|nr:MAG: hypothetical protein A2Y33_02240 [Spirochaetes bacterium GWF1_51_8]
MELFIHWALVTAGIISAFTVTVFLVPVVISIPALLSLRDTPARSAVDGVTTLDDAASMCRASGLTGWELVEYARALVSRKMSYSYRNPYDLPARAFERGLGYCWHKGWALYELLTRLGFRVQAVQAVKVMFPAGDIEGVRREGGMLGHMWVRVGIDGMTLDCDPGREDIETGELFCEPISPVVPLTPLWSAISYLGSPYVNSIRYFWWRKEKLKKMK